MRRIRLTRSTFLRTTFLGLVLLCLVIVASGIYSALLAASPGLIGHWPLNEGSGTSTLDASGNGNLAQINGATWTTGRLGNALRFDSSKHDTVDINRSVVDTSASFTVAAWVQLADMTYWRTAVSQDSDNVSGFYLQFIPKKAKFVPSEQFAFSLVNSDLTSGATIRALSNFNPVVNTWYHLVGIYDAGATRSSLYVNGILQSTQKVSAAWNADGETVIGRAKWGKATDFWSGKIDDVRLYNRALSATDVTNLYGSFRK